jgi:transposase InsO family protein
VSYQSPSAFISQSKVNHITWHLHLGHLRAEVMKIMGLPLLSNCDLCEAKSDTFGKLEKLAKLIENLQDAKIKEIMTNRGGEFINAKFKIYVADKGINHIVSPPETPEHNGYAKQENRTILDKARSLLMTSKLLNKFWAEAVNTATFILNLVFGSKVYIAIPKKHRTWKMGKTGKPRVLVGFENEATAMVGQLH